MKRYRAFSLIELLIAIFVLAVGILGVVACFSVGLRSVEYSGKATTALNTARELIELVRGRNLVNFSQRFPAADTSGLFDAPAVRRSVDSAPFANDIAPDATLKRNIRTERLSNDASSYRYNIAVIKVTVYWWDRGREKSVELTAYHRQI